MFSVNIVTIVLFAILGFLLTKKISHDANTAMDKKIDLVSNYLSKSSVKYVWNFDIAPLEIFIKEVLKDSDIRGVVFYDDAGKALTGEYVPSGSEIISEIRKDIFGEGDKRIGYVKVVYSNGVIYEQIKSNIVLLIIFILIIQCCMTLVLSLVIKGITGPLLELSNSLTTTCSVLKKSSGVLTQSSTSLAESVNEQASSLEESSASLEELTGMVNTNVSNAEKSNDVSKQVQAISSRGVAEMKNIVNSMKEIMSSNENIQALVKVIGEIGDKTAVIDEIVFQTKLLSFNASVEAERAGEYGRGFSVVAQEVGNLAQMSGKAALEISAIVKNSINTAQTITSDNKKKVETGDVLVKKTAEILTEVEKSSNLVSNYSSQILSASKEQSDGIKQINLAVSQLDQATHQNATISDEVAKSSTELEKQAEGLASIVNQLQLIIHGNKA